MISIILLLMFILIADLFITSLDILIISSVILIVMYKFEHIFKYTRIWYLIAFLLAIVSSIFYHTNYALFINKGYISLALFFIIMFAGVLNTSWLITKRILKYRSMLSIVGFILISPHALLHLFGLFASINLFGIAAYALMVPLTIISFQTVRREMKAKDWINIQKASYVIYTLLYVHVLWIATFENKLVYIVLFTLYVNNKLIKEFRK